MDDRDRQRLGNLIGHAQAAIGYARAHGRGWWRSAETLDAVLMRISQVGEAASKTSPEVLAEGSCRRRETETVEGREATLRVVGDDRAAAAATTRIEVSLAENFLR